MTIDRQKPACDRSPGEAGLVAELFGKRVGARAGVEQQRILRRARGVIEHEERQRALDPRRLAEHERIGEPARGHQRAAQIGLRQRAGNGELEIDALDEARIILARARTRLEPARGERPADVERLGDGDRGRLRQHDTDLRERVSKQLEALFEPASEQEVLARLGAQRRLLAHPAEMGGELSRVEAGLCGVGAQAAQDLGLGKLAEDVETLLRRSGKHDGRAIQLDGACECERARRVLGGAQRPAQRAFVIAALAVVACEHLGFGHIGALERVREREMELAAACIGQRGEGDLANAIVIGLDVDVGGRALDQLAPAKLVERCRIARQPGRLEGGLLADRAARDGDDVDQRACAPIELRELGLEHRSQLDRLIATVAAELEQAREQVRMTGSFAQCLLGRDPARRVTRMPRDPLLDRVAVERCDVEHRRRDTELVQTGGEPIDNGSLAELTAAIRDDQQHARRARWCEQLEQQLHAVVACPLQVVDEQGDRCVLGEVADQLAQRT